MEIWAALLGAVVGGILTGLASWLTIRWQLKIESKLQEKEKKDRINALLCALYHEIDSVWESYMSGAGKTMEELADAKDGFMYIVPSMSNYFPIYSGNVATIGLIQDALLRGKITRTYTCAMSLMDGYKLNNKLVELAEEAIERDALSPFTLQSELKKKYVEAVMARIRKVQTYGPMLKSEHTKCRDNVMNLLPVLSKYT